MAQQERDAIDLIYDECVAGEEPKHGTKCEISLRSSSRSCRSLFETRRHDERAAQRLRSLATRDHRVAASDRPSALFWVALTELDFRESVGHRRADFPYEEVRRFIDEWLSTLDPAGGEATTEWTGEGVRIGFRAKPRSPETRGWTAMPSLNLLEQKMGDLHLVDGRRRQLHTLTLEELRRLAHGELRVVGQGASYPETVAMIADMLEHFGMTEVSQLPNEQITVFAGALGLVEPPPGLGNFDQGLAGCLGDPARRIDAQAIDSGRKLRVVRQEAGVDQPEPS